VVKKARVHVHVGGLGQNPTTLQQQTELPRRAPARARALVDDDGVEQPTPANLFDKRRAQSANATAELLAEALRTLCEALVYQDVQCGHRHRTRERVPIYVCVRV
jgi:hypothetical protein